MPDFSQPPDQPFDVPTPTGVESRLGGDPLGGTGLGVNFVTGAFKTIYAAPRGDTRVMVVFDREPWAKSEFEEDDALNPAAWGIFVASTSVQIPVSFVRRLSRVMFELTTKSALFAAIRYWYVPNTGMRDSGGTLNLATGRIEFSGLASYTLDATKRLARNFGLRDFRSLPYPRSPAATLKPTNDGNYQLSESTETLDKLFLRRIVTTKGSFWHLPEYGAGVTPKSIGRGAALLRLKRQIEDEMRLEPEVVRASVSISQEPDILRVSPSIIVKGSDSFQKTEGFTVPLES